MLFEQIELWSDPIPRSGPEAMAIDECLLVNIKTPLLRVYRWDGDWGSLGYFTKKEEAQRAIPNVRWVRRWTGGGVVDHRCDWTYSLIVPHKCRISGMKAGESYRLIHELLAELLCEEGLRASLCGTSSSDGSMCFKNPVHHDVTDPTGGKLAGAAQRRSQYGLLHQGSVLALGNVDGRAKRFAEKLAQNYSEVEPCPDASTIAALVESRYASIPWLARR